MSNSRYSRQSFLGPDAENVFSQCIAGVIGLGGGGSHIIQQLSHIGFQNFTIYDGDITEYSNLNRLIGATAADEQLKISKVDISKRVICGLQPNAKIKAYKSKWQDHPSALRSCDIIFGCVDGFSERRDLEAFARRSLIPYIDIGLDVNQVEGQPPVMAGQVVLSMPGGPCLTCLGFLTETALSEEAAKYGKAGPRPQVVWANGILASIAVGIAVDLLTDWTKSLRNPVYLVYESNKGTVMTSKTLPYRNLIDCNHYPIGLSGDPVFKKI